MDNSANRTRYQEMVRKLRNTPVVAAVLLLTAVVGGVSTFIVGGENIWQTVQHRILGRTPQLAAEYCQLLRPLVVQLDRTKDAFERWNKKDLSLESETIKDGNFKARELLQNRGHLVVDSS